MVIITSEIQFNEVVLNLTSDDDHPELTFLILTSRHNKQNFGMHCKPSRAYWGGGKWDFCMNSPIIYDFGTKFWRFYTDILLLYLLLFTWRHQRRGESDLNVPFFRSMTSFVAPSIEAAGSSAKIQIFTVCCFVVSPIEVALVEGDLYRRNYQTTNGQTSSRISFWAR